MGNKPINLQALSKKLETALIPAESSNIEAFGYNIKSDKLWVLFKNKALYAYEGNGDRTLYDIFIEGLNSESKGKWVNKSLVKNKQLLVEAYEIK